MHNAASVVTFLSAARLPEMMAIACSDGVAVDALVSSGLNRGHLSISNMASPVDSDHLHQTSRQVLQSQPPPNPPFVFPAVRPGPVSAPASFARSCSSHRRPRSAADLGNKLLDKEMTLVTHTPTSNLTPTLTPSVAASLPGVRNQGFCSSSPSLPTFSFNPGALLQPRSSHHSPRSVPHSPNATPARPASVRGHKRGGSEYIGGSFWSGDAVSVTNANPAAESPFVMPNAPSNRRGHTHRRSAALSNHDMSSLMNAINARPAPTRHIDPKSDVTAPDASAMEHIQPPPAEAGRMSFKARVGFSENVEYIPRPPSLGSSIASSVGSGPACANHCATSSLSSILNAPTASDMGVTESKPEGNHVAGSTPGQREGFVQSRPSSAGVLLLGRPSLEEPTTAPSSSMQNDSCSLLTDFEPPPLPVSPVGRCLSVPVSAESTPHPGSITDAQFDESSSLSARDLGSTAGGPLHAVNTKDVVRDCPLSVVTTLHKHDDATPSVSTPGSVVFASPSSESLSTTGLSTPPFDSPTVYAPSNTAEGPGMSAAIRREFPVDSAKASQHRATNDDDIFPVIDLDAALGPFNNSSVTFNPEWEAAQQNGNVTPKRKFHSASRVRQYHRRTESAPEMSPLDRGRFGPTRLSRKMAMDDVFEEEEEEAEQGQDDEGEAKFYADGSEAFTSGTATPIWPPEPSTVTNDTFTIAENANNDWDKMDLTPDFDLRSHTPVMPLAEPSSNVSTKSLTDRPEHGEGSPAPVGVISTENNNTAFCMPDSPFSTTVSSSLPTPLSYDATTKLSTAPSSVRDETTFKSLLLLGEPGPDIRHSVDAYVPSVTSSASTMTRNVTSARHVSPVRVPDGKERPLSFSAAIFRPRSSLSSLSRLVGGSYAEHSSRHSMDIVRSAESDSENKPKSSKAKRFGRKLRFWQPLRRTLTNENKEVKEPVKMAGF